MRTADSSTDAPGAGHAGSGSGSGVPQGRVSLRARLDALLLDPLVDVGHLLAFRKASRKRRTPVLAGLIGFTLAVAVVPMWAPTSARIDRTNEVLSVVPAAMAGFLLLGIVSAVASGGGRELIPRDQAVAYPVSPTTDHLGALILAPLNIAWLLQAWLLLGSVAYGLGPDWLVAPAQLVMLLWLVAATALAQVVAWTVEAVRRQPHGLHVVRGVGLVAVAGVVTLQLTGNLTAALDRVPTQYLLASATQNFGWRWGLAVAGLVVGFVLAVVTGILPARLASGRPPRDELRLESGHHQPGPTPRSDLLALIRTDRGSVWRSVPMRRGLGVLAIGPGVVAIAGDLAWPNMTILPGLVASGGALLYGVNAWCLDGRGGLWRENLPVDPGLVFGARAWVLAEFLLTASVITILLGSLRAGAPTEAELAALVCTLVVVTVQVVAAAMRWSSQRPYAVDLRSARATPAPPAMMVAYSARLAVSTTMTGLVFSGLAHAPGWELPVLIAIPLLAWSSARLVRAHQKWLDPVTRCRVVTAVVA